MNIGDYVIFNGTYGLECGLITEVKNKIIKANKYLILKIYDKEKIKNEIQNQDKYDFIGQINKNDIIFYSNNINEIVDIFYKQKVISDYIDKILEKKKELFNKSYNTHEEFINKYVEIEGSINNAKL